MTESAIPVLRGIFLGLLVGSLIFAWLWEDGAPLRAFASPAERRRHWLRNFGMLVAVVLVADLLVGTWWLRVGDRLLDPPAGLLSPLSLSLPVQVVLAFLFVDLYEYAFHRLAHRWRPLWLVHAVHHSDPNVDSSTSFRHHPVESAIVITGRVLLYVLLGLPLWIEIVRATVANFVFVMQHANIDFPPWVERLRNVIATPAFHRVHHDPDVPCVDRNFGQIFTFWDRIFGTWHTPEGAAPREYGLRRLRDDGWQSLAGMLRTPIAAWKLKGRL